MSRSPLGTVLRHIHRAAGAPAARRLTDLHLLRRFADQRDENTFAELMRRHGPMVLGVCRRILAHEQDAEDAFQAAFLVLARKAGSIRKGESVGSFLYGVAYRIAMKECSKRSQRRRREQQVEQPMPARPVYEAAFRELQLLLDEGLHRLPEKYRTPFVLCCLEGLSKSEAARELQWKEGTVSSRLAHARKEMQQFLSRKGVTLAAVLTAAGIAEHTATAGVPPLLAASALRTALWYASGSSVAMETIRAVQWAETALRSMAALPWKTATLLLLVVSLAVGGAGLAQHDEPAKHAAASEEPQAPPNIAQKAAREEEKPRTDRFGDPLPPGALARLGTIRFRQGFLAYRAIFAPDGKAIACAAAGRGLCLWDAATGKELRRFGQNSHANAVAFSPDGKRLVSQDKGKPALFEVASGNSLGPLADAPIGVAFMAFAPDGKSVAVAQYTGGFTVWDVEGAGKSRKRFGKDKPPTRCLAYSPDSKLLATGSEDKIIHLWDAATGEERGQLTGHEKEPTSLVFYDKGRGLASASNESSIRLWDVKNRKLLRSLEDKRGEAYTLAVTHDGQTLAGGYDDGSIRLWNTQTGEAIRRWHGHTYRAFSLDFAPDGATLVSGAAWECGPRLWDTATGKEKLPSSGHHSPVDAVAYSSDGRSVLSTGRENLLLRWDLATGRESVRFDRPIWAASRYKLSPIGDVAATWVFKDKTIRLWDVAANKERHNLGKFSDRTQQGGFFPPLAFSADGRLLAFGDSEKHEIIVWEVASGKERRRYQGLRGNIVCVEFSPDGQRIAAGVRAVGVTPTLGVWDVASGAKVADFASREAVDSLVFSPDGRTLATGNWQRAPARLWDVATGRELRSLSVQAAVNGLAFSPDGKWLAGADADHDQKIHVWEVLTGQQVRCFQGHYAGAICAAFAPDSRSLVSGGADSTLLIWDLTGRQQRGGLQVAKWSPRELETRWSDLASTAGPQAMQALWDLVASPEQTAPLLRQHIKPVEAADVQRVAELIRALDSENFQTRDKATEELEKNVDGAEPALRKRLEEKPSLEMRQRIKQILDKLDPSASGERLRVLRAIQVLEYIGTPAAREHLRTLAKGLPEARLTRAAKAAVER